MSKLESLAQEKDSNWVATWFRWQYVESPKILMKIINNFLRFNLSFFSIPLLLKTLIYPWRQYHESYGRGFDPKRFFSALFFNTISRFLGAIVRMALIIIGIIIELVLLGSGLLAMIIWLLSPALLTAMLVLGVYLIITSL